MIQIAILGFGVVGSGVLEVIEKNSNSIAAKTGDQIAVKHILDIRDFKGHEFEHLFTKDYNDILDDPEVSIVVEVIGGVEPAYTYTMQAFERGKSVVTSNKELVATHGADLLACARKNKVHYMFEASVGGGIPIIRPLNQCLAANEISEIMGILNGTTNYILTQMIKKGQTFEDALKEAQEKGYAERDPKADVEGIDACRKIAILTSLISGKEVDCNKISTEGITAITLEDVKYAESLNCVIKLVGVGRKCGEKVFARVSPLMLPSDHPLAGIEDVFNGILVVGDATGDVMFYGKGAGKLPTASAVVADVIDIAKNKGKDVKFLWQPNQDESFMIDIEQTSSKFFLRTKGGSREMLEEVFPNASFVSLSLDSEIALITEEIQEGIFRKKTEDLKRSGCQVRSVIRTLI